MEICSHWIAAHAGLKVHLSHNTKAPFVMWQLK